MSAGSAVGCGTELDRANASTAAHPHWNGQLLAKTGKHRNPAVFAGSGYVVTITAYEGSVLVVRGSAIEVPHLGVRSAVLRSADVGVSYAELVESAAGRRASPTTKLTMKIRRDPAGDLYFFTGEYDAAAKQFVRLVAAIPLCESTPEEALSSRIDAIESLYRRDLGRGQNPSAQCLALMLRAAAQQPSAPGSEN